MLPLFTAQLRFSATTQKMPQVQEKPSAALIIFQAVLEEGLCNAAVVRLFVLLVCRVGSATLSGYIGEN